MRTEKNRYYPTRETWIENRHIDEPIDRWWLRDESGSIECRCCRRVLASPVIRRDALIMGWKRAPLWGWICRKCARGI